MAVLLWLCSRCILSARSLVSFVLRPLDWGSGEGEIRFEKCVAEHAPFSASCPHPGAVISGPSLPPLTSAAAILQLCFCARRERSGG